MPAMPLLLRANVSTRNNHPPNNVQQQVETLHEMLAGLYSLIRHAAVRCQLMPAEHRCPQVSLSSGGKRGRRGGGQGEARGLKPVHADGAWGLEVREPEKLAVTCLCCCSLWTLTVLC
jgi:hypothetical protein